MAAIKCGCNSIFCGAHCLPEQHDCIFDYRTAGRRLLEEVDAPLIKEDKLSLKTCRSPRRRQKCSACRLGSLKPSSRSFPTPTFKYIYQKKKGKMDMLQRKKKEAALTTGMETIDSSIAPVGYSFFRLLFPDSSFMKQLRLPRSFSGQVQVDKQKEPRQIAELINPKFQSWKVNLHKDTQGFYFFHGEGWQKLATAHKLKLGYFLTFDYNGGLLFRFRVYGLNTTEIDSYPSEEEERESKGKAVYEAVIGSTNLIRSYLHIPRSCKKLVEISMEGKKRKVVLMDGEGRKWPVRLEHKKRRCGRGRSSISVGWLSFAHGNGLRRGDRCVFEPVLHSFESFESLIKVRIIRGDV